MSTDMLSIYSLNLNAEKVGLHRLTARAQGKSPRTFVRATGYSAPPLKATMAGRFCPLYC